MYYKYVYFIKNTKHQSVEIIRSILDPLSHSCFSETPNSLVYFPNPLFLPDSKYPKKLVPSVWKVVPIPFLLSFDQSPSYLVPLAKL